ncbi:major facilitator superfamily domain-containing protein 8 [Plakobranchus ocellatus]|uniref:Major facilitator superfamily domain-containing protein 8 n=1 Tax=Plakobranchus ocellatus TaxID=259542 RepID=A0AAV3YJC2_9GAST|nr:major facilitator superfamily domain-containing protein 8 [Plakobranchus ocellatus]
MFRLRYCCKARDMAVLDDDNAPLLYRDSWLRGLDTREQQIYNENNEPPDAKQARWRSIRIIYTVVFLNAICFTISLPSLWTYLQVLDPGASTSQLGWTVAAFSLGQLVASPIFGAWANYRSSHKEPTSLSYILAALSYAFYTYLASIPGPKHYYMIAARAMLGFGAGNVAVLRSYVASATTLKERTVTMANINICASAGFVLGPLLQAAFVPMSYPGPLELPFLHVNMYTGPALLATVLSSVSAALILLVFKEHRINDEPRTEAANIQFLPSQKAGIDYVAVFTCILHFFSTAITFQIFQTLTTPLIMHNFAWSKAKATFIQGMVTGGISILAIFIYFAVKVLSNKFTERAILMTGFLFTACACFVFVPFGHTLPPRQMAPITPGNLNLSKSSPWMAFPHEILSFGAAYQYQPTDEHVQFTDVASTMMSAKPNERNSQLQPQVPHVQNTRNIRLKISNIFTNKVNMLRRGQRGYNVSKQVRSSFAERISKNHKNMLRVVSETPAYQFSRFQLFSSQDVNSPKFAHRQQLLPAHSKTDKSRLKISQPQRFSSITESTTQSPTVTTPPDGDTAEGCPWNLLWCAHVPVLHLAQYAIGTLLYGIGYPLCHVLTFTIFSKVLGSKPQGLWMGIFAASGSLAGISGPVLISHVYDLWGPRVAFTGCTAFLTLIILYTFAVIHRLIPFSQRQKQIGPLTAN